MNRRRETMQFIYVEREAAISGHTRLLRSRHKELLAFIPVHGYSSCICPSSGGFLPPPPPNSQSKPRMCMCMCVCVCARRTSTRHNSKRIDLRTLPLSLFPCVVFNPFSSRWLAFDFTTRRRMWEDGFCQRESFAKADSSWRPTC